MVLHRSRGINAAFDSTSFDAQPEHGPDVSLTTPGGASTVQGALLAGRGAATVPLAFGSTIGLSAFLLFSVEPLVGRLVLPVFGGAAGVWATVLAFFQAVLLLGYLYAHVSATRLSVRTGALLHFVLAVVAVLLTVAAPARLADVPVGGLPTLVGLVVLLAVTVGPAAFVLTATTPLMSSWYARVRRAADPTASESDPYWLYALSNGGSLVALLAYPFVFEQTIGLAAQRTAWVIGFGLLAVALAGAAIRYVGSVRAVSSGRGRGACHRRARRHPADPQPPSAVAAAVGRPRGAAVGRHEPHRHRPDLGPPAVGGTACGVPRLVRRGVLRARPGPTRPARAGAGAGDRDAAVGAAGIGGGLADRAAARDRVPGASRSLRPRSTGAWPRTGRRRTI